MPLGNSTRDASGTGQRIVEINRRPVQRSRSSATCLQTLRDRPGDRADPSGHGQFEVGGGDLVARGQAVFQGSCQFCHGVRKVGAKFGWDFVAPAPIWSLHRPSKNLFLHVAYKPLDAAERGILMPAMSFMSQDDAELLWHWLKAVATNPLPAYAPAAAAAK